MPLSRSCAIASLALILLCAVLSPRPILAQGCAFDRQRSPAVGVPEELWGELKPVDEGVLPRLRDNTDWERGGVGSFAPTSADERWTDLAIADGWIFAGIHFGLQIWDARANPANPTRTRVVDAAAFPSWTSEPHEAFPVRTVTAGPDGNHRVVAVGVAGRGGLTVFDTTWKSNPRPRYNDAGKTFLDSYAAAIGGREVLFAATQEHGLHTYDLTAVQGLSGLCSENTPYQNTCGVSLGTVGERSSAAHVSGVGNADGTKHWIAVSSASARFGFDLYDVSNPSAPSKVFSAFDGGSYASWRQVHGTALWRQGSSYFLALRRSTLVNDIYKIEIYDLGCLEEGSCSGLGQPIWSRAHESEPALNLLTFSRSGSRPFLHVGNFNRCVRTDQNEWLYDVSDPWAPRDVTPPARLVDGNEVGYWGWYYPGNVTGFNEVAALTGVFDGPYFYRAAFSIFDIHELTTDGPSGGGGAPSSGSHLFSGGFEIGTTELWSAASP